METYGSIILNVLTGVCAFGAVWRHIRKSSMDAVMKYFTALSNIFCAAACLGTALWRLTPRPAGIVLILKYMGTVSVTVTMLTVLFFLMPQYGDRALLTGPDLWLHLLCPLGALISYFAWDKPEMPFACVLLGVAPVILYGLLYLWKTVLRRTKRPWQDFYGFNRNGKWKISFICMAAAAFLISLALYAL